MKNLVFPNISFSKYLIRNTYNHLHNILRLSDVLLILFFCQGFLSQTLTIHRTAGERRGSSFIPLYHFHSIKTLRHLFETLHVRWISRIFNRNACFQIYHLNELPFDWLIDWLIDWWCNICLLTWLIDSRFLLQRFWHGKPVDLNSHRLSPLYYKRTD